MNKAIEVFVAIDKFLDGKKQMYASLTAAIGATSLIVHNIATLGIHYLLTLPHSPEFAAASIGWIGFFNALKGEKTREEVKALTVVTAGLLGDQVETYVPPAQLGTAAPKSSFLQR